ncbi:MAG TPA: hypothetical protein VFE14_07300 [Micromonosporaceae bacterium]|jgi:hypothetical protein|nr:hypothetical protein [Micromonosporaceae bacterium]
MSKHHGRRSHEQREPDERAKEQAATARLKPTRTNKSVGQANTMRLKRSNQPRHGR